MSRIHTTRGISSNGRAAALHAAGKGIDAPILHFWLECAGLSPALSLGDVAQMVERVLSMHEAMGSMPIFSTHYSLFARKHHQGLSSLGSIPSVRRHVYSRPFSSVGRAQVS